MTLALVNGHVLFPTRPNWRESVTWKRSWQTEIASALQGQETRRSLRRIPRVALTWLITTLSTEETAILETRIQAALKSGLACTGYWGRACEIKTAVTGSTAELWPGSWPWAAGDYILFIDPDTNAFDAVLVDGVDGNTLTLHASVSRTYQVCGLCWPTLFGKLQADPEALFTADKVDVKLTLVNALPSPATVPAIGDWCGHCNAALEAIGLANVCTPLLPPTALAVAGATGSCPSVTIHTLTPTLSWTPPTGAAGYVVEIFTGSCGGTLIHTSPTPDTASYTVPGGVLDIGTTYYWRVTATPASGYCTSEASACCAMTTACPTISLDDTLPDGDVGTAYSSAVTASGGTSPYLYAKTSGSLPGGLTLHTNGTLDGTPTTCGDFTFTVTATDDHGCTGSREYTIQISQVSLSPCDDCAACTPTVAVSGVPSLSDIGDLDVTVDGNGSYSFVSHDPGSCSWLLQGPSDIYGGFWNAEIWFAGGGGATLADPHGSEYGVGSQTNNFVCDCGRIRGSATLTGTVHGHAYTITITVT
jgi:hypothetical protein